MAVGSCTSASGDRTVSTTDDSPFTPTKGLFGFVASWNSGEDFTVALTPLRLKDPKVAVTIESVRFVSDEPIEIVGAGVIAPGAGQRSWAGPGWSQKVAVGGSKAAITAFPTQITGSGQWILAVGGRVPATDRVTSTAMTLTYSTAHGKSDYTITTPMIICGNAKTREKECLPRARKDHDRMMGQGSAL